MELPRPLAVVTPTLDGDVLAALARADASFTTGQLHRMLPAWSEDGVRRVLRRLVAQGIVSADRVGNAYSYRLNRQHLAAEHVIGLANLMSALLTRLTDRLEGWDPRPVYAAVFGSAAQGRMQRDSDIDLLLIRPDAADDDVWDQQVQSLTVDLSRWTGNDARALVLYEADVTPDEQVLLDVLDHGLTVAGNRAWLSRRTRRARTHA